MRLPHARFSVRWMMGAVAVLSAVAGIWVRAERWEHRRRCQGMAANFARAEAQMRRVADGAAKLGTAEVVLRSVREEGDFYRRASRWWALRAERAPRDVAPTEPNWSDNRNPVDP
jgi:hypothetical protein